MRRENFQGVEKTRTGLPEPRSRRKRAAAFSCRYLVEGSCGIPFYCEELLRNLDHHRVLVFHPLECEEKTNVTWNNLFSKCHRLALSPRPLQRGGQHGRVHGLPSPRAEGLGRPGMSDPTSEIMRECGIVCDPPNCRTPAVDVREHGAPQS